MADLECMQASRGAYASLEKEYCDSRRQVRRLCVAYARVQVEGTGLGELPQGKRA